MNVLVITFFLLLYFLKSLVFTNFVEKSQLHIKRSGEKTCLEYLRLIYKCFLNHISTAFNTCVCQRHHVSIWINAVDAISYGLFKFICLQLPSFGSYCYLDFKGNILNFHKSTIKKILITKCEVKYKGR